MKVVSYGRVSTEDQSSESQIYEIRNFCHRRGWNVVKEVIDHGFSGGTLNRPGLKEVLALARSRKIDAVVVQKLDRLFRSLKHMVLILQEFEELGVQFVSIKDHLDFTTSSGRLLANLLACFGEFERALVRERTLAGLSHAKRKGKILGRPRLGLETQIQALYLNGLTYRQIQKQLGVSLGTISRCIKTIQKTSPKLLPKTSIKSGTDYD